MGRSSVFSFLSLFSDERRRVRFGLHDLLSLRDVSDVNLSPDGQFVAYTVAHNDMEADVIRETVWMQSIDAGDPFPMTSTDSDANTPRFSPDGAFLAVLSNRKDETDQVWLLDRRGGDARQLTRLKQGVEDFGFSPDGKRLWLLVEDPANDEDDDSDRPNPPPYVVNRLQFKQDTVGYLGRQRTHIHLLDVASGESRQLTSGDCDDSEPDFSPDGQRLVFVSDRGQPVDQAPNTHLFVINIDDDGAEPIALTRSQQSFASPSWSPDGKRIVHTTTVAGALPVYAIPQLSIMDVSAQETKVIGGLTEIQAVDCRFTADGESLLAITEQRGEQHLVQVSLADHSVTTLVSNDDVVTELDVAVDGTVVLLVTRSDSPDDCFVLDSSALRRVSYANRELLHKKTLAEVEKFTCRSADDTEIEVLVAFPANRKRDKRGPGVVLLHGGPQEQHDVGFDKEAQLLAANGYCVIMPNPRGSWGYGQDFANAIVANWGSKDAEDVFAAVDFAVQQRWVDADQLGVMGWSYGGMLVNHIITKTERFKAAITGASATLYMANYGHDQYQQWWEQELGLPWLAENRDKWNRISPFFSLDKVVTPTLIVGGEDDWNVPILNSEQLYMALRRQGVETELVVYPNEGHEISVPSYEKDLYERYLAWLDQYVRR
ncbi:MAG: S9 family peptidase [Pseudomonadota bacterium]